MIEALTISNLQKSFGSKKAVHDLSFRVAKGQIYGFLGPNGAGKTTSLRMILGLLEPDQGNIAILGHSRGLDISEKIGYLPEERGLYPHLSPLEVLRYLGMLKGMTAKDAKTRSLSLLEEIGLGPVMKKPIKALSKGMAQKVQVLAAIIHRPEIVFFDEPFSGLDPVNQKMLEELIVDLKAQGTSILFSTHVMQHVERLCDRLLIMAQGTARFEGSVEEANAILPHKLIFTFNQALPQAMLGRFGLQLEERNGETKWEERSVSYHLSYHRESKDHQHAKQSHAFSSFDLDSILREILNYSMSSLENPLKLLDIDVKHAQLHDVFVHLVGESIDHA